MDCSIKDPGLHVIKQSDGSSNVVILQDETVEQLSCGLRHSVIVCKSGRVFVFGINNCGQLGLEDDERCFIENPTLVAALASVPVSQVACGDYHTLFLSGGGEVYSCGHNSRGQLGIGNKTDRKLPTRVTDIPPIKMVAAGGGHSVLLATSGELLVAGSNDNGQLGLGNKQSHISFTVVPSVEANISSLSCGGFHTAFVTSSSGVLYMTGHNGFGQLGLGHTTASLTPKPVTLPAAVTAVACGGLYSEALTADGTVWAWGWNEDGQLGIGTNVVTATPVKMVSLDDHAITKIITGWYSAALITKESKLLVCGQLHIPSRNGARHVNVMTKVNQAPHLVVDQVAIADDYTLVSAVVKHNPS